jgi:hypothetical protein
MSEGRKISEEMENYLEIFTTEKCFGAKKFRSTF